MPPVSVLRACRMVNARQFLPGAASAAILKYQPFEITE